MAKKGDILRVSIIRNLNFGPDHYGIYDGEGGVFHFSGETVENAKIEYTSFDSFTNGGIAYIENLFGNKFSPDEIIERASSKVGTDFGGYDLIKNNCEHFAYWCVTGIRRSYQTINVNSNDDERDVVEKAIDKTFEPIISAAKFIDKLFKLDYPANKNY